MKWSVWYKWQLRSGFKYIIKNIYSAEIDSNNTTIYNNVNI